MKYTRKNLIILNKICVEVFGVDVAEVKGGLLFSLEEINEPLAHLTYYMSEIILSRYDEIPLYVNTKTDYGTVLVKWRLTIGR